MVYNHENDKLSDNFVLFYVFSRLCHSYSEFKRIVIFLGCLNFFAREMRYTLNCLGAASASTHKFDFGDVGQWSIWVKSFLSIEISLTQKEPLSYCQEELQTHMLYMWSGSKLYRWTCHMIKYIILYTICFYICMNLKKIYV